jgi:hypothetical protein
MTTTKVRRVRGYLENGQYVLVPKDELPNFVGCDMDGNPIVRCTEAPFIGELMGLTYCCGATGKGSVGATVCRSCYREVSDALGGTYTESDIYIKAKVTA